MGWLRRLFGTDKPSSPATAGVEPTARTGTGKDWLTGDPPVPPLHATPRQAQYTLDDGREGIVEGFELRASDGRLLYDNRCGVTRWGHLGLYQPDVVGESYRGQQALAAAVPGAAVKLVPEPDNEHDPGAIMVAVDGRHVGYIARRNQRSLKRVLKACNGELYAVVWNTYRTRGGDVVAVTIMLIRPDALASHPFELPAPHGMLT